MKNYYIVKLYCWVASTYCIWGRGASRKIWSSLQPVTSSQWLHWKRSKSRKCLLFVNI